MSPGGNRRIPFFNPLSLSLVQSWLLKTELTKIVATSDSWSACLAALPMSWTRAPLLTLSEVMYLEETYVILYRYHFDIIYLDLMSKILAFLGYVIPIFPKNKIRFSYFLLIS